MRHVSVGFMVLAFITASKGKVLAREHVHSGSGRHRAHPTVTAPANNSAANTSGPTRPPKPHAVSAPSLPEVPSLAKQERLGAPPRTPKNTYECGTAFSGETEVPLVCIDDHDEPSSERTATLLVPHDRQKPSLAALPRVVDHRADGVEAPVRAQGPAGTCSTFAVEAALDHSVARWTGAPAHTSTMQIWGLYHRANLWSALNAVAGRTIAAEETWPYDARVARTWGECSSKSARTHDDRPCGLPVDALGLSSANASPVVIVEKVESLPLDFALIRAKIAAGDDPVFAMRVSSHFKPVGRPGARYIADYDGEAGGHIMALAGYAVLGNDEGKDGDNYYLLHNSWGTRWGDGGYAWIHEATLKKHVRSRLGVIDARPVDAQSERHAGVTCFSGEVPDSVTGMCAPPCADQSPRHGGTCAVASDCQAGYVNLVGTCVAAAPTDASTDEQSHISWRCGPGGCAYTLPKATSACGSSSSPCLVSCPAPTFRVAKDHRGITCVS
jgi:hypothetical protein